MIHSIRLLVLSVILAIATVSVAVADDETCVIPASGPWPVCARGENTQASTETNSDNGATTEACVVPETGKWPACAMGGRPSRTSPSNIDQEAAIYTFSMTPDRVLPGRQTVTLNWTTNADNVTLYYQGTMRTFSGSDQTFTTQIDAGLYQSFLLVAQKGETQAEQTLAIHCKTEAWFFTGAPDGCPIPTDGSGDSAVQYFQNGMMRWHRTEFTQRIHVFYYEDQTWDVFQDFFSDPNNPDSNPTLTPPDGYYKPVRGFGAVWSDLTIRDKLGWATTAEIGFAGHVQCTGPNLSDLTCFGSTENNRVIVWNDETWWLVWGDS